ncbi:RNA-guided endonuclease InsQ/TnpB family protein [Nocardiopsis suaedae]|uniref:Transposase n=1 Tax=Nocardiopsis suaedae TaxID=3018444 RepID=A0ABT4TSB5_9ACTN|nr:transposase [Nocardiopsis suaedae]MDA2807245.1 transposase [Nocardiopsis suaedae]
MAASKAAHRAREECGPARLDRMLTGWRSAKRWLRKGASVPQQQTVRDFAASRAKALKDIKARLPVHRRAGMPRFKKRDRADPTLNYTRRGFRLRDGRLHLAGGIAVRVVWSRALPADPTSVRIYRDCLGHWYASFVVPAAVEPLPATGRTLGVDWGVKEVATTTSDDHDLAHPQHGERAAAKLHKRVARDHDRIAVEDFKPRFLAKSTMARKAVDAAISATKAALVEMGRKHARDVRLVHPAHTTMDCASCGARTKHALPLSEKTYARTACGAVSPRDKNSARVMLVRAGWTPDGVEGLRPSGPQARTAA